MSPNASTAAKWITGVVNATPHGPARRVGDHRLVFVFLGKEERDEALDKQTEAVVGVPVGITNVTVSGVS